MELIGKRRVIFRAFFFPTLKVHVLQAAGEVLEDEGLFEEEEEDETGALAMCVHIFLKVDSC